MAVVVVDVRGVCGWFFWIVGYIILLQLLYYFIVMYILFYSVES